MEAKYQEIADQVEPMLITGAAQGTAKWHEIRKYTIGGSSLATIIGANKYESLESFLLARINGAFKTSPAIQWGSTFEQVIKSYIERTEHTRIVYDDAICSPRECCTYSPDGLAVIHGKIVLLEFKCPYSRFPRAGVPDYYLPQILMGLDTFHCAEYALFIEAVFRYCEFDKYDARDYHDQINDTDKMAAFDPQARGALCFNAHDPEHELANIYDVFDYDLARVQEVQEEVFEEYTRGNLDCEIFWGDSAITEARAYLDPDTGVGILAWKLLFAKKKRVDRVAGYIDQHYDKIQRAVSILREVGELPTRERKKRINELLA